MEQKGKELQKMQKMNDDVIEKSLSLLEVLVEDCPPPTDLELKKLLGLQAAVLNSMGVQLFESAKGMKKMEGRLRLVIKAFEASRSAAEAAARIKTDDFPNGKPSGGEGES